MFYVNRNIRSESEAADFVRICDQNFDYRLYQLVHSIVCDNPSKVLTLSGPTCSGKTTAARMLTSEIEQAGKKARILSIDDFFRDRSRLRNGDGTLDYDSAAAIDLEYLAECTAAMLQGRKVMLPRYDFHTGMRAGLYEYCPDPEDIVIFEGIQAVYPEVTALLQGNLYKSIFIDVSDDILVNGTLFSRIEVRLIRRLVRDMRFRSTSPEDTFFLWETVRSNEEKNIFPYASSCMYHINSLQPYELFMIGQFALPLLESVGVDSRYFSTAQNLAGKLHQIAGNDIDPGFLSPNSIYHEFLG